MAGAFDGALTLASRTEQPKATAVTAAQSILAFRVEGSEDRPPRAILVALHGFRGDVDELLPLARSLGGDLRVYAAESPRPAAYGMIGPDDRLIWELGQSWYLFEGMDKIEIVDDIDQIEPATFKDNLVQIEKFLLDVGDTENRSARGVPIVLLGFGQGAVMALSIAAIAPRLIDGVIAICGHLPSVVLDEWQPFKKNMTGFPILYVYDDTDECVPRRFAGRTVQRFRRAMASLTVERRSGVRQLGEDLGERLRGWLDSSLPR